MQHTPKQTIEVFETKPEKHTLLSRLGSKTLKSYITASPSDLQENQTLLHGKQVIYVMPQTHSFDFMLLTLACQKFNLPIPTCAPYIYLTNVPNRGLRYKSISAPETEVKQVLASLEKNQPVCLFLKMKNRTNAILNESLWDKVLLNVNAGANDIVFVPILLTWDPKPGNLKASLFDSLFHERSSASRIHRTCSILWHRKRLVFSMGEPLHLKAFNDRINPASQHLAAKKLRRTLASYLHREKHVLSGPPLQSTSRVLRSVMKDQQLQNEIKAISSRKKVSLHSIEKTVRKQLKEMVAMYNPFFVECARRFVNRIRIHMFDSISLSEESIMRLKNASKKGALILMPNHRSHVDYLMISYLFVTHRIPLPRVAAGINLSFFPVGFVLRRCGAYFIRRSLSGDPLYSKTLRAYVRWLVQHDITQEFFIEGGRSRTGRLLPPKLGLLTFQVESYLRNPTRDIMLLPTAIMYDWVPEQTSLARECLGEEKSKESLWNLLQAIQLFRRNHGDMRIEVGDAISLKHYFQEEIEKNETTVAKQKLRHLGAITIAHIADIAKVTPRLIASTACLTLSSTFSKNDFQSCYESLRMCLPSSRLIEHSDSQIDTFWEQGRKEGWIAQQSKNQFKIEPAVRMRLDYHRQCILHFFAQVATDHNDTLLNSVLNREFPFLGLLTPIKKSAERLHRGRLTTLYEVFFNTIKTHELIEEMGMTVSAESVIKTLKQRYPDRPEICNKILLQNSIDAIKKATPADSEETPSQAPSQHFLQNT